MAGWFDNADGALRRRTAGLYAVLLAANLLAWAWALLAFSGHPALLGTALLAYTFGLRHAVDADHIAAIDNVTRKLMGENRRPVSVGFFFALGHSTVVVLASVAIAATATAFKDRLELMHGVGGVVGTLVSTSFLLLIAAANLLVLRATWRAFRRVRAGEGFREEELNALSPGGGLLTRCVRPAFRLVRQSWHMFPLGFLFGLGFDTATEVGLLGIAATEASRGLSSWSILVFPALFTAGMALVDTTDGVLMLGAYGWALRDPGRKLRYNLAVTTVSVAAALLVGGTEALGLLNDRLDLQGPFWDAIGALNNNFGVIGYGIAGVFAVTWLVSMVRHRYRRRAA